MGVIGIQNDPDNQATQPINSQKLVCRLKGTSNCPGCSGTVWFEESGNDILVTAKVEGLEVDSVHGIHVHQVIIILKSFFIPNWCLS